MEKQRIYLVEDDNSIRELVAYTLEGSGYSAEGFPDSEPFWGRLRAQKPDLILLDIMLPGEDGLQILKKLHQSAEYQGIPVIMLTAKSTEYDRVVGLDGGADDYIGKPFGMMELVSRVKAVLRRSKGETPHAVLTAGPLEVDPGRYSVTAHGEPITLTLKEFELLKLLMENRGVVLTRDRILEKIWGYDFDGETRTVDVHIRTLRSKLGAAGELVETVRGIGYKLRS